jgi:predicted metal-dependent HD superfamily phosphohydrolase
MPADAWRTVIPQLEARYREPQRAYHDLAHIRDLLRLHGEIAGRLDDPRTVEMAIWFHDAVYDPHAHDNEEQSARLVRPMLTGLVEDADIDRVEALVRVTDGHRLPEGTEPGIAHDMAYFIDADLSSLGAPRPVFDRNSANIRTEYAHVPEEAFNAGRARILRMFLDRQPLYLTSWFRERYEAQARENLSRGLQDLGYPV